MVIRHLKMDWTTEKAVNLLSLFGYKKSHLRTLSDYDLFKIGLREKAFKGKNPFKRESQILLSEVR